jgi:hypothetical protein
MGELAVRLEREARGTIAWETPIPNHDRNAIVFMDHFYDSGKVKSLWLYRSKESSLEDGLDGCYYLDARYKITIIACSAYRMIDEAYRLNEDWQIKDCGVTAIMSPSAWIEQLKRDEPQNPWNVQHYIVATGNEIFEFLASHEPTVEAFPMSPPWIPITKWKGGDPQTDSHDRIARLPASK